MMTAFNSVPIPTRCFKGIHSNKIMTLVRNVIIPMLNPVFIDSPSERTTQGLMPKDAAIISDSPSPNNVRPIQRKKTVNGRGAGFKGLLELQ